MAKKNKLGLHFEGWEEYMAKLDELGDSDAMKRGVEAGLIEAKKVVTPQIQQLVNNLPAKGKYSTGNTEKSINTDLIVDWDGPTGSIDIGFNLNESGDTSIFLMHGTPKTPPVKGLKTAIYGKKTQEEVAQAEMQAIQKVINRIMND